MTILLRLLTSGRFVYLVSRTLDRCPGLKKRLRKCYQILTYWLWRFELKARSYHVDKAVDLNKTYWISPNRIVYRAWEFNIYADTGKVTGGDWDLPRNRTRFVDLDCYQAFCQRFLEHKSWEETEYYHRTLGLALSGQAKWAYNSRTEVDQKFKKLDELYQTIRDNGYKTQEELATDSRSLFRGDEVTVSIACTGELLFTNGRHRLIIAKILGLKEVPVKVTVRHSGWVKFRNQIIDYAESQPAKKVYQPLLHPDLADIPSVYGHERFEIIKQNLTIKTGTLLDIGAHWGYFCHKFEDEGFACHAVESDAVHIYFLNRLRQAESKRFEAFHGSIFDYGERTDFDVVLALNIFYHFLKDRSSYLELIELLKRLRVRELFLQTPKYGGQELENAYKNYSPDEFVAFILKNSCLQEARYIGSTQDERRLYKLYGEHENTS